MSKYEHIRGIVYVSGPYTASNYRATHRNIEVAEQYTESLWKLGFGVMCPHSNTKHMELRAPKVPYEHYMELDLKLIESCDAIFMLPGWEDSRGSNLEMEHAKALGIPVFMTVFDMTLAFPRAEGASLLHDTR